MDRPRVVLDEPDVLEAGPRTPRRGLLVLAVAVLAGAAAVVLLDRDTPPPPSLVAVLDPRASTEPLVEVQDGGLSVRVELPLPVRNDGARDVAVFEGGTGDLVLGDRVVVPAGGEAVVPLVLQVPCDERPTTGVLGVRVRLELRASDGTSGRADLPSGTGGSVRGLLASTCGYLSPGEGLGLSVEAVRRVDGRVRLDAVLSNAAREPAVVTGISAAGEPVRVRDGAGTALPLPLSLPGAGLVGDLQVRRVQLDLAACAELLLVELEGASARFPVEGC